MYHTSIGGRNKRRTTSAARKGSWKTMLELLILFATVNRFNGRSNWQKVSSGSSCINFCCWSPLSGSTSRSCCDRWHFPLHLLFGWSLLMQSTRAIKSWLILKSRIMLYLPRMGSKKTKISNIDIALFKNLIGGICSKVAMKYQHKSD